MTEMSSILFWWCHSQEHWCHTLREMNCLINDCAIIDWRESPSSDTTYCPASLSVSVWPVWFANFSRDLLVSNTSDICRLSHFFATGDTKLIWHYTTICPTHTWFQHDGASPHYGWYVRVLNPMIGHQWIGHSESISSPPRSPNLRNTDLFLWDALTNDVYAKPVDSDMNLRLQSSCVLTSHIEKNPGKFEWVRQSIVRPCNASIDSNGGNFEDVSWHFHT